MAFQRASGKTNIQYRAKTASTAISNGALVYTASGQLIPADATSGDHYGIAMKPVASGDSDYASTTKIPVDVAGEDDIFRVKCAESTVETLLALVGTYIDLTSSILADATASNKDALLVVGVISADEILVKIASRENILRTATT